MGLNEERMGLAERRVHALPPRAGRLPSRDERGRLYWIWGGQNADALTPALSRPSSLRYAATGREREFL